MFKKIELDTHTLPVLPGSKSRRKKPLKLHLPDCQKVQSGHTQPCDCGQPQHPLPPHLEFFKDADGRVRTRKRKGSKK